MSAHVLLFYKTSWRKEINARLAEHFISFSQRVKKINNTGARMLDSIYHMTLNIT